MIFLQLPEFNKEPEECETFFDRWIYVLKNMEIFDRMPWAAQYAAFKRLSEICEVAALTPRERERYEESIKVYRDNLAIAERAVEEGFAKGHAEGLAKGHAEGLAKGHAEGLAEGEHRKQIDIALQMKKAGLPLEQITQFTGLSVDEINHL